MTDDIEENIREIQNKLETKTNKTKTNSKDNLLNKINQKILDSNGFLTKEGGYLCKAEWHAVMIGVSFPAIAFMLPSPLGEFCIVAMLLMLRVGFKQLGKGLEGHMADVMHELAYMLASAMITIALFKYGTSETLTEIDIGQALVQLLVGI